MYEYKVKDIIVMGDFNEHVENKTILQFIKENGLVNVHKHVNNIDGNELDNTYKYGMKCIDAVFCTYGLIEFISGSQMVECDEIIMNDHRGYLIDIEIERYCQCKPNTYNKPRHTILDNAKKSHVAKFNK
jgi:hypothetical protein